MEKELVRIFESTSVNAEIGGKLNKAVLKSIRPGFLDYCKPGIREPVCTKNFQKSTQPRELIIVKKAPFVYVCRYHPTSAGPAYRTAKIVRQGIEPHGGECDGPPFIIAAALKRIGEEKVRNVKTNENKTVEQAISKNESLAVSDNRKLAVLEGTYVLVSQDILERFLDVPLERFLGLSTTLIKKPTNVWMKRVIQKHGFVEGMIALLTGAWSGFNNVV